MEYLLSAFALVTLIFVLLVLAFIYASRYKKVGPNQVLVISGRGQAYKDPSTGQITRRSYRLVHGGGTFVWPVLERVDEMSLEIMTIDVVTTRVYTKVGVPVTVDGVAQIKVRGDDVSISTAAEQFLSKTVAEIKNIALQTLEGHLRAILGALTVEEIYRDRDAFAQRVQEVAAADLQNMGLGIVSFTIRDIQDDQGYLDALGQARIAEVKRDATIGQALAARDATIRSAQANQEGQAAKYLADTKIAESNKDYSVQKAAYDQEVNRRKAEAELAYLLQQNITNQQVKAEEIQVLVVEKAKQIELQQQEVLRRQQELDATVKKPAEAEAVKIQTLASATKFQTLTQAEGQAAATRSIGQGDADATRARGLAQAEIVKAQGLAQADVIRAQGFAEAEAMQKKALAWQEYNQAAIIQQLIEALPKVAAAIAQPLAQTERIVIISGAGGPGDGAGASKVTQDIVNIVAQVPATLEALTGVDLVGTIKDLPVIRSTQDRKRPPAQSG
ncbi:MAG: SPFH domain-containing protein [Chloroflexota bacterium]|nr:SPFH domain-containing protein [Chloroflexota bacterium]